ncbi:heme ABC exporter ATP-binding protein CcmA [Pararhizobium sp.]|uniref:heme ABC exporter ATP-binding protein CcmA n=1 Tax=Pararhizobium sp. TaxID=1977563 RepID=UPI00271DAC0E|nr:heme ABC exporter ATP-binding protein CcmA [Pararhizobium sp.]MDO9416569.1 heme ABC exporter ATP-binding protein CcmA [Pararhizobium sp.]
MRLIVEDLSAKRGDDLIFQDISFVLDASEALVVTGANGSGKSTLLRVLAGLLAAETGTVRIEGFDAEIERAGEVSHYLGHRNAMKRELTVGENLTFWKRYLGDSPHGTGMDIDEATDAVGLGDLVQIPFGYLSAGQQRRMAMAKLLVSYRPVWILDEPTAALDTGADQLFAGLVTRHRANGGIVIAATHQPLGFEQAKVLDMKSFAAVLQEEWA